MSLVLDASILVKLFRREEDSGIAKAAITSWAERQRQLLAPHLVVYETLSVALHYKVPFGIPLGLIADLRRTGLRLVHPTMQELKRAEAIARLRPQPQARPPQLRDSIYHAMAIERGGTFVTADLKHVEKTRHLGNVLALTEWQGDQP